MVKHVVEDCQGGARESITVQQMRRAVGILEVNCYEVHSFVRHAEDFLYRPKSVLKGMGVF